MATRDDANVIVDGEARPWSRRSDRRADLRRVLLALAAGLVGRREDRSLRRLFEEELSRVVPARSIRMREIPMRFQARLVTPTRTAHSLVVDVPTPDPFRQVVLEATFDPGRAVDQWNADLLTAAAHLGAVVLEADAHRPGLPLVSRVTGAAPLIGSTPVMRALRDRVERVAKTDFAVLIEGESGTGKELVARQIHELSWRRRGPFIAVNCAALVDTLVEAELFGIEDRTATGVKGRRGKFEHAHRGTLFLDEIADLSMAAQAKLLRALQDLSVERVGGHLTRRVDVRIIAASNRQLSDLVAAGLFRSDLFYRLSGVEVHVPTLRSRPGDVLELAKYFLSLHSEKGGFSLTDAAGDALQLYAWPGNVRELERLIERAVALAAAERIDVGDLPSHIRGDYAAVFEPAVAAGETMRAWGSRYARLIFERCGRNKRKACRVLGISYHTLDAYLRYAESRAGGRRRMPAWVAASRPAQPAACPLRQSVTTSSGPR